MSCFHFLTNPIATCFSVDLHNDTLKMQLLLYQYTGHQTIIIISQLRQTLESEALKLNITLHTKEKWSSLSSFQKNREQENHDKHAICL